MFYDKFYSLCQEHGVTPTQVARDLGIRQSTVSMWKKQGTTPKYETSKKLSDYFGVDVDELLKEPVWSIKAGGKITAGGGIKAKCGVKADGGIETGGPIEVGGVIEVGKNQKALLEMVDKMSESEMRVALAMIKQMIAERPETTPQSPPAPQDGKDTTPPPDVPETAPEGE